MRKVLYVPRDGNDYAPYEIVQGCRHHNVVDAISGDPLDSKLYPRRLQEFQQRMERLCRNEPLYDRFDLGHGLLANKDSGFIATPFDSQDGFERGVEAALKGLDIAVNNPRREYNMKRRITEKIADMITESKIVLANMMYANGKGFNPNVFYEMGYGQAKEKTILPFRPRRDEPQAPIDIRDRDYIEYEDAIEVAMTLYWGLKDIVENGSSATTP